MSSRQTEFRAMLAEGRVGDVRRIMGELYPKDPAAARDAVRAAQTAYFARQIDAIQLEDIVTYARGLGHGMLMSEDADGFKKPAKFTSLHYYAMIGLRQLSKILSNFDEIRVWYVHRSPASSSLRLPGGQTIEPGMVFFEDPDSTDLVPLPGVTVNLSGIVKLTGNVDLQHLYVITRDVFDRYAGNPDNPDDGYVRELDKSKKLKVKNALLKIKDEIIPLARRMGEPKTDDVADESANGSFVVEGWQFTLKDGVVVAMDEVVVGPGAPSTASPTTASGSTISRGVIRRAAATLNRAVANPDNVQFRYFAPDTGGNKQTIKGSRFMTGDIVVYNPKTRTATQLYGDEGGKQWIVNPQNQRLIQRTRVGTKARDMTSNASRDFHIDDESMWKTITEPATIAALRKRLRQGGVFSVQSAINSALRKE